MTIRAIVGMQWGDEGKGKIVDALSEKVEIVVRAQGGANAGHTVVVDGTVYKLHVIPSGILRKGVTSVIGNGVVVDPLGLVDEINAVKAQGVDVADKLLLSDRAHLVMPYHCVLDGLNENQLGKKKIGTTGRGIGPTYADKMARQGLRGFDLLDEKDFARKCREHLDAANLRITWLEGTALDVDETIDRLMEARNILAPLVTGTVDYLHEAYAAGKDMLFEGAQGTQLDIDFGTYPFVTSSNTTAGGFATGSGLPPAAITEIHGVFKAFTTRVGEGPFVTEVEEDALLMKLRGTGANQWDEFGTTTGRPRRCGWTDLVVGRFGARVNGLTHLHITKLDILSGFGEIRICTAYELDGKTINSLPADAATLARCQPVYESVPGWEGAISDIRKFGDLPEGAQKFVARIFEELNVTQGSVSVGPGREQYIEVDI